MHLKFITDNWQMHNFQPVINFLTKFKLINRHSVTIRNLTVETCDRKKLNVCGKICKIKLSDKGTSSSGWGAG